MPAQTTTIPAPPEHWSDMRKAAWRDGYLAALTLIQSRVLTEVDTAFATTDARTGSAFSTDVWLHLRAAVTNACTPSV